MPRDKFEVRRFTLHAMRPAAEFSVSSCQLPVAKDQQPGTSCQFQVFSLKFDASRATRDGLPPAGQIARGLSAKRAAGSAASGVWSGPFEA